MTINFYGKGLNAYNWTILKICNNFSFIIKKHLYFVFWNYRNILPFDERILYPIFLGPVRTNFVPFVNEANISCFDVSSNVFGEWSLDLPSKSSEEES